MIDFNIAGSQFLLQTREQKRCTVNKNEKARDENGADIAGKKRGTLFLAVSCNSVPQHFAATPSGFNTSFVKTVALSDFVNRGSKIQTLSRVIEVV